MKPVAPRHWPDQWHVAIAAAAPFMLFAGVTGWAAATATPLSPLALVAGGIGAAAVATAASVLIVQRGVASTGTPTAAAARGIPVRGQAMADDNHGEPLPATIWLNREPGHVPVPPAAGPCPDQPEDIGLALMELRALERQLAVAKAEAQAADAAKSRFMAAASHDLRQPFQAMNLYLQVLQSMDFGPPAKTAIDHLGASIQAGEELLKALLDISAFEAGTVVAQISRFDVASLIDELFAEYRPVAEERHLSLRKFGIDAMVKTDRVLAKRMVRNLVHNAFRYTQGGGILIGSRRRGSRVLVQVYDTGPGIPADKLHMIFEDFYRLGSPSRDHSKGLGLGLTIVQRTAHLLGQEVWVASRQGHGSAFSVTLPIAQDNSAPEFEIPGRNA
jgi:signal transduction histidine kinase